MKAARSVVILAIATALIFAMYWLRPKSGTAPAPEQREVAISSEHSSPSATAPIAEPTTEANDDLPEFIPLPLTPIALEAENGMWRTNSDYQINPARRAITRRN